MVLTESHNRDTKDKDDERGEQSGEADEGIAGNPLLASPSCSCGLQRSGHSSPPEERILDGAADGEVSCQSRQVDEGGTHRRDSRTGARFGFQGAEFQFACGTLRSTASGLRTFGMWCSMVECANGTKQLREWLPGVHSFQQNREGGIAAESFYLELWRKRFPSVDIVRTFSYTSGLDEEWKSGRVPIL